MSRRRERRIKKMLLLLMLIDESVVVIRMFKAQICLCVYRRGGERLSLSTTICTHTQIRSNKTKKKIKTKHLRLSVNS